ncbi:MAG: extracellular solute-binding protein [Eubacteriales bacterium]|nr:extracellular solute-binding protein [Eubacteriales bacterium]MDD3073031.1 extracellular solute-binding protein [Eubacteriales bacterium]MDD4079270.1 extracellular solute-binding protein [Eubacteriales bacterium]
MAAKIMVLLLCVFLFVNCSGSQPEPINPVAPLDPELIYIVEYWDVEPPVAMDPQGLYRPGVERLAKEFGAANPGIDVRIRWLKWAEAEDELTRALRDGNPPDIFADWQGIARRDHVLQIPADTWLNAELLTEVGKRLAAHEGRIWAWPRWLWPTGLLTLGSRIDLSAEELARLVSSSWDWQQLGQWLQSQGLHLEANDWEGEFTSQAMLASTGCGWGRWGGQELHQVLAGLEILAQERLASGGGEYLKLTEGAVVIGGAAPAFMTWLAEEIPDDEVVLLPLPSVGPSRYLPITGVSLVQFRQLRYKGDEHARAAALAAEFLAREQGAQLAQQLRAASAWNEPQQEWAALPPWHSLLLREAAEQGVPSRAVDMAGRRWEQELRGRAALLLADFWAGRITAQELARGIEDLQ